ncbi:MAG TPA: hypothetical protein PLW94_03055 [Candidatus Absconditabacterales bacterium]|nr:hypothetical protein [Candidatus Absconditabacterales bacterium]
MTNINKDKVIELRKQGYSYKEISRELSITILDVRNICSELVLVGNCKNCDKEIRSTKGKKIKQFCSDECRWNWWNNYYKK